MVKIYCDWNVIAHMKNGAHKELEGIFLDDPEIFIAYSTSHIDDVLSSHMESDEQRQRIKDDLIYLSRLTGNKFLFNDGKQIHLEIRSPQEQYEDRLEEKDMFRDISFDALFNFFETNDEIKDQTGLLRDKMESLPLDDPFKKAFEDPQSAAMMESMFPGLRENPTMKGFFDTFNKLFTTLNEGDGYKGLRSMVQSGLGINRDKIINADDPYRLIQKQYDRLGFQIQPNIHEGKNAPIWYDQISNEYLMLDMHGYQEDRVNVSKGRKETFKNTTEDAFHCAFASMGHFYITNDKKSYQKSKKVYEKLAIPTIVMRPNEFLEYYRKYLFFDRKLLGISILNEVLKNGKYDESSTNEAVFRTYLLRSFLFGFFNKIIVYQPFDQSESSIVLSRHNSEQYVTYVMEISRLAVHITELMGDDLDKFGEVSDEEFLEEPWKGRRWKWGENIFSLKSVNGHIQLYID